MMAHVHRQAACVIRGGGGVVNKGMLGNYVRSPGDVVTVAFQTALAV